MRIVRRLTGGVVGLLAAAAIAGGSAFPGDSAASAPQAAAGAIVIDWP
ncbi:hypothetical protein ACFVP0_05505 [Streptomyces cinereoruber]